MLSGDHFLQVLRNTITGVLRLSPVLAEPQEAVDPVCGAGVPPSVQPRRERGGRGGVVDSLSGYHESSLCPVGSARSLCVIYQMP